MLQLVLYLFFIYFLIIFWPRLTLRKLVPPLLLAIQENLIYKSFKLIISYVIKIGIDDNNIVVSKRQI